MDHDNWHVLEWSESQKQFHVTTLNGCAESGLKAFFKKVSSDWIVLGVFPSREKLESFQDEICIKRGLQWDGSSYVDTQAETN